MDAKFSMFFNRAIVYKIADYWCSVKVHVIDAYTIHLVPIDFDDIQTLQSIIDAIESIAFYVRDGYLRELFMRSWIITYSDNALLAVGTTLLSFSKTVSDVP